MYGKLDFRCLPCLLDKIFRRKCSAWKTLKKIKQIHIKLFHRISLQSSKRYAKWLSSVNWWKHCTLFLQKENLWPNYSRTLWALRHRWMNNSLLRLYKHQRSNTSRSKNKIQSNLCYSWKPQRGSWARTIKRNWLTTSKQSIAGLWRNFNRYSGLANLISVQGVFMKQLPKRSIFW